MHSAAGGGASWRPGPLSPNQILSEKSTPWPESVSNNGLEFPPNAAAMWEVKSVQPVAFPEASRHPSPASMPEVVALIPQSL